MATILKSGSRGNEVKQMQTWLRKLGYNIQADGVFGPGTRATVISFQQAHNLAPDGIAGPNTLTALEDLANDAPIYGIDVSHHNNTINWNDVAAAQIKFAICKATQGKTYKDPTLNAHLNELKRLNIIRSAYHFFTFIGSPVADQVNNFISCGINFQMPGTLAPVLDVEWQASASLNEQIKNNPAPNIQRMKDWLTAVEQQTGRKPIIYTAKGFWNDILGNPAGFEQYDLWVASYRTDRPTLPGVWANYKIWQFTESASVPGITGNCDKNLFNGKISALKKMALL